MRPGFSTRLALMYSAILAMGGIQLPFFPLWLNARGLDERAMGLVLAIPMIVRVVAIPVATGQADRSGALRGVIAASAIAATVGYVLVGLSAGVAAIAATVTLASLAYTPVMPLTETYALRGLAARGRAYGPVRLWGSAAFIVGTFIAGTAADLVPASQLIWLIAGFCALMAGAAVALEPVSLPPDENAGAVPPRASLLRQPVFLLVIAAASLIQAGHAMYYGFSTLAWTQAGYDGTQVAALWALGVIAEIILFAVSGRLPPGLTPMALLMVGAGGGLVRWLAMALDPPAVMLPALQLLHALTFGATHLGTLGLIARLAPPGRAASAQGLLAIAMGATMALLTGVSGWLFANYGAAGYAAMALAAVAGGACALAAQTLATKLAAGSVAGPDAG